MREILFRGKRLDNGEWVYGLLCRVGDTYVLNSIHQSKHNKGKKITEQQKQSIRISNHKRKGKRAKYKSEVTPETVFALNLDWGCVKQRYEDYVHDNPELLEGKTCYRAQLTQDLRDNQYWYLRLPISWANFKGTGECPLSKKVSK